MPPGRSMVARSGTGWPPRRGQQQERGSLVMQMIRTHFRRRCEAFFIRTHVRATVQRLTRGGGPGDHEPCLRAAGERRFAAGSAGSRARPRARAACSARRARPAVPHDRTALPGCLAPCPAGLRRAAWPGRTRAAWPACTRAAWPGRPAGDGPGRGAPAPGRTRQRMARGCFRLRARMRESPQHVSARQAKAAIGR